MPLWNPGKSLCPICGDVMAAEQGVFVTPPFVSRGDPQGSLSDAVVHSECLLHLPGRDQLIDRIRKVYSDAGARLPDYFEPRLAHLLSNQ